MPSSGGTFEEIEHTADLAVEATAADLPGLFSVAGEGLFGIIADRSTFEPRERIPVAAAGNGEEELLHAWLCELLALFNLENFLGKSCAVDEITASSVAGSVTGERLDPTRHRFRTEIKGVTYHQFRVWQANGLWHARVIFDV